jgi:hypothetical protein
MATVRKCNGGLPRGIVWGVITKQGGNNIFSWGKKKNTKENPSLRHCYNSAAQGRDNRQIHAWRSQVAKCVMGALLWPVEHRRQVSICGPAIPPPVRPDRVGGGVY